MAKKVELIKPKYKDFAVGENNAVIAVYVTGPEILVKDNPNLIGMPFIFYNGTTRHSIVDNLRSEGISYLDGGLLEGLTKNARNDGEVPETIHVHGRNIAWQELYGGVVGPFGGVYVPYSFGIYHNDDLRREFKVRAQTDYNKMVREILPEIFERRHAEAEKEAQIKAFYSNPFNRTLSFLTAGLYGPKV